MEATEEKGGPGVISGATEGKWRVTHTTVKHSRAIKGCAKQTWVTDFCERDEGH